MKRQHYLLVASLFYISCSHTAGNSNTHVSNPPATVRTPVTDTYFGLKVIDNYRWLENMKDSGVLGWFKEQAEYTNSYLDKIPGRTRWWQPLQGWTPYNLLK